MQHRMYYGNFKLVWDFVDAFKDFSLQTDGKLKTNRFQVTKGLENVN